MPQRCFPPPWSLDEADPEVDRRCFIVRDANGQALAWMSIGEEEPGPASSSHGVHCHPAVMRGQLQFELARSCRGSLLMPTSPHPPPFFRCPSCKALYQVVKAEAGPETVDVEVACSICRGPLGAREGQFVLKYFLLRKAIPVKRPTARRARPR